MRNNVPENQARQGPLGRPVLVVLIAALLLAIAAWGVAEIYGVVIKGPSTDQQDSQAPAGTNPNPASTDPVQTQSDSVNSQPIDQNPKVDKNPTPQSSTGGDQQGVQPSQPTAH
ncbi:hypothetical protein EJ076_33520 [Mesorhizobium sp. M7D.F.Ca.US.005.01.1.1]|jgi:hypothetical protein|uniref:hypothetical protein n=1 Tax=Mesorhizobium sp. M7D.F.Ca.US.005.01.1.1 TaxID=2493678 RepID=UPI000F7629B5|nr:hypothetical protein [Mesorhizobium sp. M7D.F.Ca.US.005.01.1.1]AZO45649.1 hypothetical protein EJ076_33520 [Mesorhizobium sp. M7D.F.Ca.US.005.01.1.1]